jgi:hypothetical protein
VTSDVIRKMKATSKVYWEWIIDVVYDASVFSVISYAVALLILIFIGLAITDRIIYVPVFHPDIPITSGD